MEYKIADHFGKPVTSSKIKFVLSQKHALRWRLEFIAGALSGSAGERKDVDSGGKPGYNAVSLGVPIDPGECETAMVI